MRDMKIFLPLLLLLVLVGATSCEKEFIPEIPGEVESLVVEGYIEAGDRPTPPYVILTRSRAFFAELSVEELENAFVHDAVVIVDNGEQSRQLTELCLEELTPEQRALAGALFGLEVDSFGFNFCIYADLSFQMQGQAGRRYDLTIETPAGEVLTATTTIPPSIPLDSLWFVPPPGEPVDTLAQLRCTISDPDSLKSFYQYFTQVNDEPFVRPFSSVIDDRLFDGQSFEFPLSKAEPFDAEAFDLETFGLYRRGDTATIKWVNLDEAHFNFWNTLEFNTANQGPFSSYTRIESNIEGGLGIWGGRSVLYYDLTVPEE